MPMQSLGIFSVSSVHVFRAFMMSCVCAVLVSAATDLKHCLFSRCASMERKGGGYRQLEERQKRQRLAQQQQSHVAQYLVLRPAPLPIPPPISL